MVENDTVCLLVDWHGYVGVVRFCREEEDPSDYKSTVSVYMRCSHCADLLSTLPNVIVTCLQNHCMTPGPK